MQSRAGQREGIKRLCGHQTAQEAPENCWPLELLMPLCGHEIRKHLIVLTLTSGHGRRRRKNVGPFVAAMITDLLVPSSLTLAVFVIQFD